MTSDDKDRLWFVETGGLFDALCYVCWQFANLAIACRVAGQGVGCFA